MLQILHNQGGYKTRKTKDTRKGQEDYLKKNKKMKVRIIFQGVICIGIFLVCHQKIGQPEVLAYLGTMFPHFRNQLTDFLFKLQEQPFADVLQNRRL